MNPVEGELLPALRAPAPPVRHAACGHVQRDAQRAHALAVVTLCGVVTGWPLTTDRAAAKCPDCLAASTQHAQRCACWKFWPNGRLPDA